MRYLNITVDPVIREGLIGLLAMFGLGVSIVFTTLLLLLATC